MLPPRLLPALIPGFFVPIPGLISLMLGIMPILLAKLLPKLLPKLLVRLLPMLNSKLGYFLFMPAKFGFAIGLIGF